MNLKLVRHWFGEKNTVGELFIDDTFECYILEDKVRELPGIPVEQWKIKGQTAIPYGTYEVVITLSPKYRKPMPLLLDVPGFVGIRIHPGNTDVDTEGCLLTGQEFDPLNLNWVGKSKISFDKLLIKLQLGLDSGPVQIQIVKEEPKFMVLDSEITN